MIFSPGFCLANHLKAGNLESETETWRRESVAAGVGSVMDGRRRDPPRELPGSFLSVV